jgi:hypothetical protein
MVLDSRVDGKHPIELLVEEEAGELVGQGKG